MTLQTAKEPGSINPIYSNGFLSGPVLPAGPLATARLSTVTASPNNNSFSTSEMFFAAKGTYYYVQYPTNSGKCIYAIEGLNKFNDAADDAAAQQQSNQQMLGVQDQIATETLKQNNYQTGQAFANLSGYDAAASNYAQSMVTSQATVNSLQAQQLKLQQSYSQQTAATAAERLQRQQVPVLITGIRPRQIDIISAMACLGNVKVFYTMGQNFAEGTVSGMMLLGPLGSGAVDGVSVLNKFFNKYRVSILHRSITISIATQAYEFFLTSLSLGEIDKELHILPFILQGVIVDPAGGDLQSVNPDYSLNTTLVAPNAVTNLTTKFTGATAPATVATVAPQLIAEPTAASLIPGNFVAAQNTISPKTVAPLPLTPAESAQAGVFQSLNAPATTTTAAQALENKLSSIQGTPTAQSGVLGGATAAGQENVISYQSILSAPAKPIYTGPSFNSRQ